MGWVFTAVGAIIADWGRIEKGKDMRGAKKLRMLK